MKMVGLDPEAVELFHSTISKQSSVDYERVGLEGCLGELFTRSTRQKAPFVVLTELISQLFGAVGYL